MGEMFEKLGRRILVGRNSDRHAWGREVRPRRQEHSTQERSNSGRMLPILRSQIGKVGSRHGCAKGIGTRQRAAG
jgi:hypothetical protein